MRATLNTQLPGMEKSDGIPNGGRGEPGCVELGFEATLL